MASVACSSDSASRGASAGSRPGARLTLGRFLLLFVATRLLYLVSIEPSHLVTYGEELYRGTIAHEIVTGLSAPLLDYRADDYSGGSLVIGVLDAGFFLLFGSTLFALKLAPMALFTLALAAWCWTVRRVAGPRTAGYFALLFCFSPPSLTAYSVTSMGFHSESTVFSALTVLLLFEMLVDDTGSPVSPVLLGLTAGFGLWFCYTYGLTLVTMLGFWVWRARGARWSGRIPWFALGFCVGFSPWVVINTQNHFAGLVVTGIPAWQHFGLDPLRQGVSDPRKLAAYDFFANSAWPELSDLPRRSVNLLYAVLYLGPILAAAVLRVTAGRFRRAEQDPTRPSLAGLSALYLIAFTLAVQFSDFKDMRYYVAAYPFLFFLTAHSLARCQDMLPRVQRRLHVVFMASGLALGMGTHVPLLSLDRPATALRIKGYAYALLPSAYMYTHAPGRVGDYESVLEVLGRPFLSSILLKLSSDDRRELSLGIVGLLVDVFPLHGEAERLLPVERLVPYGFEKHFYYQSGAATINEFPNELPKAFAAMEMVRHRSAALHHLALVGIYRYWPHVAAPDTSPESLARAPAPSTPALSPHHWRAVGYLAGRYWSKTDRSLSLLDAQVRAFVPRLDPAVRRSFLQGIGEFLFERFVSTPGATPAELERFSAAYQEDLLEGFGIELEERDLFSVFPWKGEDSLDWPSWTKGLSAKGIAAVRRGRRQFAALFELAADDAWSHAPAPL